MIGRMFLPFTPFEPLRNAIMNSIFKVPRVGDLFSTGTRVATSICNVFLQQIRSEEVFNNRIKISNRDVDDIADVN